ncbi:MAG: hypothetical protein O7G30_11820 [Proteobacteria bacterium]|nr:hypothetical protein [Pseudomonadota bacterium]
MRFNSGRLLSQLLLSIVFAPAPASAEKDLPFPSGFAERVEGTFFAGGAVSAEKVERYRAVLEARRYELVGIYEANYRASGRSAESAEKRALKKKRVAIYDLLVGKNGWIARLESESDPVAARRLAGRILEMDYALKVEGQKPFSVRVLNHIPWMTVVSWSVPAETRAEDAGLEASNLHNPETGRFYDVDDLARMIASGADLSELQPPPDSSFWRNPGAIAEIDVANAFYGGGAPVHAGLTSRFPTEAQLDEVRKSQTKPKFDIEIEENGSKREYKLKVGGEIHSEPTVGALMATLGLNTDVTRYVRDFRIDLGDADVDTVRDDWRSYFENHRLHLRYSFDDFFEVGEDERGRFIVAREAVLEAKSDELIRVGPWPFGASGNEGYREVRGLSIFSIWVGNTDLKEAENNKLILRETEEGVQVFHVQHDLGHSLGRILPEELNAFPWDMIEWTLRDRIQFNYHSAQKNSLRNRATYADARWMVRLIAQLTREQIADAVALGHWPRAAGQLLVEKLVNRRNQLVDAFDLAGAETPSGPIGLLPVDRQLTTADGAVVDGELVTGRFEGSTQEFANYWERFLGPVWDRVALTAVSLFQGSVGQVAEFVLDPDQLDIPDSLVAEIILNFNRVVVENPTPTGPEDYYVVRDDFIVGLRLGAGLLAEGVVTVYRRYTLLQPAGTESEARYKGGTVLNLALPFRLVEEKLPDRYVLIRETYLDAGGRLITDRLGGPPVIPGVEVSLVRARLSRSVLARNRGELRAYRDLEVFNEEGYRLFLSVYLLRFPLARGVARQGDLTGDLFVLPGDPAARTPEMNEAIDRVVRWGDFKGVERLSTPLHLESDFHEWNQRASIGWFLGTWRSSRFDDVTASVGDDPDRERRFVQYRARGGLFWSFLDVGESHRFLVRTVAPVNRKTGHLEEAVVEASYLSDDRNTWSEELEVGFLRMANGVAHFEDGRPGDTLIEFTPSAHSVNNRWGHTFARIDLGFSVRAVRRLRAIRPEPYWAELSRTLGIEREELDRYVRWMGERGKLRLLYRRRVPNRLHRPLLHSRNLLRVLERARRSGNPEDAITAPVNALVDATDWDRHGYDPRLLATVRRLVGPDEVSIDARLTQPAWVEKRLLGDVDLVGRSHETPFRTAAEEISFRPEGTLGFYTMLDTFPDPRDEMEDR